MDARRTATGRRRSTARPNSPGSGNTHGRPACSTIGFCRPWRREAAWLRAHVEGIDPGRERDLLAALQRLVQHAAGIGLRVELNVSRLRDDGRWRTALRPEVVDAVTDATREALTNAAKHAGVDCAIVRAAATGSALTISVLDHGCGFDPTTARHGIGLDRSIRARIAELGGYARIESTPDAGTYIELVVPIERT